MRILLPWFRVLILMLIVSLGFTGIARSYIVTELQATKANGQIFLTWKNATATNLQYNVYRSLSPFVSAADLNTSTFLGYVRDNSGKNIRKSSLLGGNHYFKLTETAPPLASDRGLYVATCTNNGSYYYAVTVVTLSNNQEDKSVLNASNSLITPITEIMANPQPVLQLQSVETDGTLRYEYAQWGNNQDASHYLAFTNSGSYAWNFTVFKRGNSTNKSIYVLFNDDNPFSTSGVMNMCDDCNVLKIDDHLPNGTDTYWSGWNQNYNMYATNNPVATQGVIKMYTQVRLKEMLEWVKKGISADSNKVYITGVSHNAFGALLTAEMWPGMITAAFAKNPPIMIKAMNNTDREQQWCDNVLNLPTDYIDPNTGLPVSMWDMLDIRHMYLVNENRGGPFISGINGKQDVTVGWVQKYYWYDTVNASKQGGVWYWDQRTHNNSGAKFTDEEVTVNYERFTLAQSFPAFSYCSINQNPGNGTPSNGDAVGALNGYLDWSDESIIDNASNYAITCFVKNMYAGGVLMPNQYDSCTTNLTFRRLQQFHPNIGQTIVWKVKNSDNQVVQQGSIVYSGGPITLNGIKIYRSNSYITLSTGNCLTYYIDNDQDGYGSSADPGTTYCTPPSDMVLNNADCNDANAAIKPTAQEVCDANDVDEDCDGLADDADASSTGKITYYVDADHDGFGSSSGAGVALCNQPAWTTTNNTDCNDANAAINPNAQEICDANDADEDCDGLADDNDASSTGQITYYVDADHDGFGSASDAGNDYCNQPLWTTTDHTDCNDANASVHPGASEVCNLMDDDCDILIDENAGFLFYIDQDNDGYGNLNFPLIACVPPIGYVTLSTDCNDGDANVNPAATDMCDGLDNNCNGVVDENAITVSISPAGSVGVCNNEFVTFTASGTNITSYKWYKGTNPNPVAGQTNSTYTLVSENTTVKAVVSNSFGCSATSNVTTITKLSNPVAEINVSNGGNLSLCTGPVNLTTPGGISWQWYRNGILLSGATNNNYAVTSNGNYTVMVTNVYGCSKISSAVTVTDASEITVSISPAGSIGVCNNEFVTFTASGTNITSYKWYKGTNPNPVAGQTNSTYTLVSENTTVKAVVSNSFGCSATSNVTTITKLSNPVAEINVSNGGNLSLCTGPVNLTTPGGISWQWYRNGILLSGATNNNYAVTSNGNYTVMVTNVYGCSKISSGVTVTDASEITVSISPAGSIGVCNNEFVTFTASGTNITSYKWYKGTNPNPVTGQTNSTYTLVSENTTVKAVVSNSFGCSATSNVTTITKLSNPVAEINVSNGGNLNLCMGPVNLTTPGGISWQWYRNGILLSGATNNNYTVTSNGSYTVMVTNVYGCSKISPAVTVTDACKQIKEESEPLLLQVYPNPSKGLFNLAIDDINEASVMIRLYDLTGRLILTRDEGVQDVNYHSTLDLTGNASGIYLVEMIVDNQLIHSTIINQR